MKLPGCRPFFFAGTKLVTQPEGTILWVDRDYERVQTLLEELQTNSGVLSAKGDRWIEADTKKGKKKTKPYENRIKPPQLKDGIVSHTGLSLKSNDKVITTTLSPLNDVSLHHAHLAPGVYQLQIGRSFSKDEIVSMIEENLPAPEVGIPLKDILASIQERVSIAVHEMPFQLNQKGLKEFINGNSNQGILRANPLKGDRLLPVLTEIEAAEILKEMLDDSTKAEMQAALDKSRKPHQFSVSNKFIKRIKTILNPAEED